MTTQTLPRTQLQEQLTRLRRRAAERGMAALLPEELLALAVAIATKGSRTDWDQVTTRLWETFAAVPALLDADPAALRRAGAPPSVVELLQVVRVLGRDGLHARSTPKLQVREPASVFHSFRARFAGTLHEEFYCVYLDGRNRVLREVLVSRGSLTASLVHPREVFRNAIRAAAAAVILVHNHPSGDPSPSQEDSHLTRRLAQVGELVGIPVLDHVIVGADRFFSFRDTGFLEPGGPYAPGSRHAPCDRPSEDGTT